MGMRLSTRVDGVLAFKMTTLSVAGGAVLESSIEVLLGHVGHRIGVLSYRNMI